MYGLLQLLLLLPLNAHIWASNFGPPEEILGRRKNKKEKSEKQTEYK